MADWKWLDKQCRVFPCLLGLHPYVYVSWVNLEGADRLATYGHSFLRLDGHYHINMVIICFTRFPKLQRKSGGSGTFKYIYIYFFSAWAKSWPEMNLKINPICKYPRGRHLCECTTLARSGSFITEPTWLKPSDILEVRVGFFCFCFLWLSQDESAAEHLRCKPSHEEGRLFSLRAHRLRLHICLWKPC